MVVVGEYRRVIRVSERLRRLGWRGIKDSLLKLKAQSSSKIRFLLISCYKAGDIDVHELIILTLVHPSYGCLQCIHNKYDILTT
jgi:hypothetical protein